MNTMDVHGLKVQECGELEDGMVEPVVYNEYTRMGCLRWAIWKENGNWLFL